MTLAATQEETYLIPTVTGTGAPERPVTVTWTSPTQTLTFTVPVTADGTWQQPPPTLTGAGKYVITATQSGPDTRATQKPIAARQTVLIEDALDVAQRSDNGEYSFKVTGQSNATVELTYSDDTTRSVPLSSVGAAMLTCPTVPTSESPVIVAVRYITSSTHGLSKDLSYLYPPASEAPPASPGTEPQSLR